MVRITKIFGLASILLLCQITYAQTLNKIVLDNKDIISGHYFAAEPPTDSFSGVLVLLAGFGQRPEDSPPETKLHHEGYANNILTIFYASGNKLYADSITQLKLSNVIKDVLTHFKVKSNVFVIRHS